MSAKGRVPSPNGNCAHFGLEFLERREFLSVNYDVGPDFIAPKWFQDSGTRVDAPIEDRWILQINREGMKNIDSVQDYWSVFAGAPFKVAYIDGLGMAGQFLIVTPGADAGTVSAWLASSGLIAHFSQDALYSVDPVLSAETALTGVQAGEGADNSAELTAATMKHGLLTNDTGGGEVVIAAPLASLLQVNAATNVDSPMFVGPLELAAVSLGTAHMNKVAAPARFTPADSSISMLSQSWGGEQADGDMFSPLARKSPLTHELLDVLALPGLTPLIV